MLATDLTLDSSTAITAGTSNSAVFSLMAPVSGVNNSAVRSVASVALTAPVSLKIAHSTRTIKGLKTVSNPSISGSEVIFDRHLVRKDTTVAQTGHLDPAFKIARSVQVVFEMPRLGSESPTTVQMIDDLLAVVAMLRASSNANLVRLFNGES